MNINQLSALRKVASAYENIYAYEYGLDKEASLKRQLLRGVVKGKNAAKTAGTAVSNAFNRTKTAFNKGGFSGGMTSLKRQGQQAGKAIQNGWNSLDGKTKAGVIAGAGALGGVAIGRMMGSGEEDAEQQPPVRGYRYR